MLGLQIPTSTLLSEYKTFTKDSSAANEAKGKIRIQYHYTQLLALANNYTTEKTRYVSAKNNQRSILMFPDFQFLKELSFKDAGGTWNPVDVIDSSNIWNQLVNTDTTGSIPNIARIMNHEGNMYLELDPIPNADGTANIELIYQGYHDPLSFPADYITGTVSVTQGSPVVTGSGTTFTAAMVRRGIKIDKYWYEIKSFTDTTHLVLVNNYQESSVAGASYQISELLRMPPEYDYIPVYGATEEFWRPSNGKKADEYKVKYVDGVKLMQSRYQSKTKGAVTPGIPVGLRRSSVPRNYPNGNIG